MLAVVARNQSDSRRWRVRTFRSTLLATVIGARRVHPHSVLRPPWAIQHCSPLLAGGRVAVPDVPSALSVEPAMSRSSRRPLRWPVADCSARCTCLASQLMYAAVAYPQANPAPAQGLQWHSVLHTSRLAFHIFTPQPSGLEGFCRHGPDWRAVGRAAARLVEPISL